MAILPNVDDQFKEIRDQLISRMEKDADLLMYMRNNWNDGNSYSPVCNFMTDKYSISIKVKD